MLALISMDTIGARLKQARKALRISQERLAGMCRMNPTTVWRIERGVTRPQASSLHRLAKALKVSAQWLSKGIGESNQALPEMVPLAVLQTVQRLAAERPELLPITDEELAMLTRSKGREGRPPTPAELEFELTSWRMMLTLSEEEQAAYKLSADRLAAAPQKT